MPRIDRYILSQFTALFGFFALVLIAVYWLNRSVVLFEQLIADGQTALVVLEFTALTLPLVISLVLPVAGFAASAYGTNRLAGESELVVMQAAGMSPWRMARPVLVFGVMVGIMVGVLVHGLVPMARARLADRQAEVAQNVVSRFLRSGSFQFPTKGLTLFIGDVAADGTLHDVLIEDGRDPARTTLYTAEEALIAKSDTGPKLVMVKGLTQQAQKGADGNTRLAITRFADLTYDIGGLIGSGRRAAGGDLRDYSTPRLLNPDDALLASARATPAEARLQAHVRLAQPLLAPVAALLGFAVLLIGGYSRFGVGPQMLLAVGALVGLQFLATSGEAMAARDPAMAWPAVYLAPLLGGAVVAAALWLAGRPRGPRRGAPAQGAPA
ncbi:LPS export ABC transporter permease LptF [Paracoccus suum]|uniref:LPS export ABC transporter permease LptF n=1 Tax=Paracoccus suum TaxID=2259340 RepID=A0A344PGH0_9RHOB|nr:LPS export ABC transporter permease LptF [Paracoccus suum]AXC48475.1 LPS export ABC transporter permease LptF [Paracoccus suum]